MNTSHLLTRGAVLAVGGVVCTMFAFGTQVTPLGDGAIAKQFGSRRSCVNTKMREPVLIYDATGSTLLGPSHTQLSVYSDGLVTLSRIDPIDPAGDPGGDPDGGRVAVRTISPEAVQVLELSLAAAGAGQLCDDSSNVSDMPLTTVTVCSLPGMSDSSHTFSYWASLSGPAGAVEAVLRGFAEAEFGGL